MSHENNDKQSLASLENKKINGSYCKYKQSLGSSTNSQYFLFSGNNVNILSTIKSCSIAILRSPLIDVD